LADRAGVADRCTSRRYCSIVCSMFPRNIIRRLQRHATLPCRSEASKTTGLPNHERHLRGTAPTGRAARFPTARAGHYYGYFRRRLSTWGRNCVRCCAVAPVTRAATPRPPACAIRFNHRCPLYFELDGTFPTTGQPVWPATSIRPAGLRHRDRGRYRLAFDGDADRFFRRPTKGAESGSAVCCNRPGCWRLGPEQGDSVSVSPPT